ncbi:PREDICTED: lamin-like protein [Tarenaya hassleriana]|uniref:lamin-like protein n=1 Tax=Tarenaya hassleriana TaxID=28532 RepID=UPI00053C25B5|nr:PREDICTED: lamin-like protein [Tarenaya hassleriana]
MKNLLNLSMNLYVPMIVTITWMNAISVEPSLHRVGGGQYTWKPDINFSDWSSHERFIVGDWIYFGFDRSKHNVLQVNQTAYEQCIETGFISNVTRGGRDVFQLVQTKPYYFICGRGYCKNSMKVAVNVLPPQPPPPPSPSILSPATPPATTPRPESYTTATMAATFFILFVLFFA